MPAVWYVYAIVEASGAPGLKLPPGIAGVQPAPVIAAGGLAAIAAQVDAARLDTTQTDWAVKAHDGVIQEIFFQGVPVLPLRFGVVHNSRSAVVAQLVTQHAWMRAELNRIREAAHWSVRIATDAWLERRAHREPVARQANPIYDGRIYLARRTSVKLMPALGPRRDRQVTSVERRPWMRMG